MKCTVLVTNMFDRILHRQRLHSLVLMLISLHAVAAKQTALAGAVTVASSLDYGVSNTSLKHLLPLVSGCQ